MSLSNFWWSCDKESGYNFGNNYGSILANLSFNYKKCNDECHGLFFGKMKKYPDGTCSKNSSQDQNDKMIASEQKVLFLLVAK